MRHHPAAVVGDRARAFFQERISGPVVVSLVGRLFAAGSVWIGRDADDRLFVAIDPLLSEPVAIDISMGSNATAGATDLSTTLPSVIEVAGGHLMKSRPIAFGDYALVSTHSGQLVGVTQEMFDQLIQVLEQFKVEEGGHFDPDVDEPIEFMALWRGDQPSRTLLGYWAGLSPQHEDARQIHFRGRGTWVPRKAADAPPAESVVRVHPSHWRALTRAIDDSDLIPDAALMLLPVAASGEGFTVRDLPAETAESLAQAHLEHGGSREDPLGQFIDGRAEWGSDLLLEVLLNLANDRPVSLSHQPSAEENSVKPAPPAGPREHDNPPHDHREPVDSAVEFPVAPADSSWTTLADYAIALAGTPHLAEPQACEDRDCALFHAALAVMTQSEGVDQDDESQDRFDWYRFAIEELTSEALRSLASLRKPFSSVYMEAPPGPFVHWYRDQVPPIREAHERTLAALAQMLSGLFMLANPDQGAADLSEDALRQAGFEIPAWRDPLDDW